MNAFAASGILGLLVEYSLKTTVVLTLALLAAAVSRRRPAAFRHFLLSFALIGLLLLPILSIAPVGWQTSLLPSRPAAKEALTEIPDGKSSPAEPARIPEMTKSMTAGSRPPAANIRSIEPSALRLPDSPSSHIAAAGTRSEVRMRALSRGAAEIALVVLWSSGLLVLVLRLAFGLAGAVRLTAQGTALRDPAWRILLERFLSLVPLRRRVRLKSHPEVLMPLTWGWRKPVILMPTGADAWSEEERSSALFHELSHVKRADFLVMLLVRTSLAVFWFNPLCWIVYRELRKEQEIACDELVLRAGIKPSTYAASLLAFRRSAGFRWNPSAALLGMLGRSSFHERLAAILKQKLTFKEVKMKTRIMLAAAVVLAVALIGTARPAVGIEKSAVTTTVVETAAPAPASFDVAPPGPAAQEAQAEKAAVQEKEKEQEKAKAAEKSRKEKAVLEKKIVATSRDGAKNPIEITITEGDQVRTLVLDKPLIVTTGEGGNILVLSSGGKDIQVLKGEPLSLVIKGGAYKIFEEEGGGQFMVYRTVEGKPGEGQVTRIVKGREGPKDVKVVVKTVTEAEPEIAWTIKEPGKGEGVWVAKKFSGKPVAGTWVGKGGRGFAFSSATDKEMLEKVHAMQEQVAAIKAKKMDITSLEDSLKKLEAELQAKEDKVREIKVKTEKEAGEAAEPDTIAEGKAEGSVVVFNKRIRSEAAEAGEAAELKGVTKGMAKDTGMIQIVLTSQEGEAGRKSYELALAKLKKELPAGYKLLDQTYDPESGAMTFKIAPPEGKKSDEKFVRKLVESLRAEIDKK